jgi:coenzyme Q-binding protein COQ10
LRQDVPLISGAFLLNTAHQITEPLMPTHSETRFMPYTAAEMYALVADVGSYPKFLPWNSAARIRSRRPIDGGGEVMEADLVISFKVFRERFASRVTLWPEVHKIDTEYLDGPFKHMRSNWAFANAPGGCNVTFFVDFEFRNAILQGIIGVVFNDAMQLVVRAFERRAVELYGRRA